jgi:hypothetical protein
MVRWEDGKMVRWEDGKIVRVCVLGFKNINE